MGQLGGECHSSSVAPRDRSPDGVPVCREGPAERAWAATAHPVQPLQHRACSSQQPLSRHRSPSKNGSQGKTPAPSAVPENGGDIGAASRRPPSASHPGCVKGLSECWWQWPTLSKSLMLFPVRTGCSADSCPAVPLSPCVREHTPHKAAPPPHAHGCPHVRKGESRAAALSQTPSFCTDKQTALSDGISHQI